MDTRLFIGWYVIGSCADSLMSLIRQSPPQRYVFWQPIPSMHQLPFLDALADRSDVEVVCAYAEPITEDRLRLGWGGTETCRVALVSPDARQAEAMIRNAGPETLNVVSGMHCHPSVVRWFRHAITSDAPLALITESYDPRGVKGMIRRIRSAVDAVRYRDRIRLLFAMGAIGERWFRRAGFRRDSIRPFAYVAASTERNLSRGSPDSTVRLAFVGQLVPRKGVDVLIEALGLVRGLPWSLTIVGGGVAEHDLRRLAARRGLVERIEWKGSMPNSDVAPLLAMHDALILPSRYDGWGAVVNESLAVGTPALCSDACGAADLIASASCGDVFRADDPAALAGSIRRRIEQGVVSPGSRAALAEHAKRFSPPAIADYFHAAVRASFCGLPSPSPPWRSVA